MERKSILVRSQKDSSDQDRGNEVVPIVPKQGSYNNDDVDTRILQKNGNNSFENTSWEVASCAFDVSERMVDDDFHFPETTDTFREAIANMPLGKVNHLKEKLGLTLFNKTFFPLGSSESKKKPRFSGSSVRRNPKRPSEVSSKKPVLKHKNVFGNEKTKKNKYDPRFDERCGTFNEHIYKTNFNFLNELKQDEKRVLKREVKLLERENPEKAQKVKETLKKICNREKTLAELDRRKEVICEIRRENNERLRQGLKPIFRTRAEIRKRILEKKFDELKKGNRLTKYMERRAKRQEKKELASI